MISFWILLEGSENGQMARAWRWCLLRLPPSRSTLEIHAKPPWEIWKNFSTGHGHVRSIGESSSHREVVFGGEIPESLHFVLTEVGRARFECVCRRLLDTDTSIAKIGDHRLR